MGGGSRARASGRFLQDLLDRAGRQPEAVARPAVARGCWVPIDRRPVSTALYTPQTPRVHAGGRSAPWGDRVAPVVTLAAPKRRVPATTRIVVSLQTTAILLSKMCAHARRRSRRHPCSTGGVLRNPSPARRTHRFPAEYQQSHRRPSRTPPRAQRSQACRFTNGRTALPLRVPLSGAAGGGRSRGRRARARLIRPAAAARPCRRRERRRSLCRADVVPLCVCL